MKDLSVTMVREHMENIPEIPIPEGFGIRITVPVRGTSGRTSSKPRNLSLRLMMIALIGSLAPI